MRYINQPELQAVEAVLALLTVASERLQDRGGEQVVEQSAVGAALANEQRNSTHWPSPRAAVAARRHESYNARIS